jgi:acetyl-CoA carboxylase carboxyl transferase subunit beta
VGGRVAGRPVAVICSEFALLGGTISGAAADRIAAVRSATRERLPLLALRANKRNLHANGLIDQIVRPEQLPAVLGRVMAHLSGVRSTHPSPFASGQAVAPPASAPWDAVTSTRRPDRPDLQDLLREATNMIPLGYPGRGLTLAPAQFGDTSCVVVGQDRTTHGTTAIQPRDLTTARRGMHLAADLHLQLVTVIDTPGAGLSVHAEEHGLAREIAVCLTELISPPVPTCPCCSAPAPAEPPSPCYPPIGSLPPATPLAHPAAPRGASTIMHGTHPTTQNLTWGERFGPGRLRLRRSPDAPSNSAAKA